MTALVVVMALCVFAVISFGEKADPLADELYANDSVTINKSQAVMMADSSVQLAIDAVVPAGSSVSANDTARVASNASGVCPYRAVIRIRYHSYSEQWRDVRRCITG